MLWKTPLRLSMLCVLLLAACSGAATPTTAPDVVPTATEAPTVAAPTAPAPTALPPTAIAPTAALTAAPAQLSTPVPPTAPPNATPASGPTPAPTAAPQQPPIAHLAAGQPVTITAIQMFDANTGWAVAQAATDANDHILQTADGGNTWHDVTPPEPSLPPDPNLGPGKNAATFFMNVNDAWVAFGYPAGAPVPPEAVAVVWNTHDGGQSWTASAPVTTTAELEQYWPTNLVFANGTDGWLLAHAGAGMSHDYVVIFATHDAGASWAEVVDPQAPPDPGTLAMSCYKSGLVFLDANQGWVSGDCGGVVPGAPYFYQTADGGHTWQKLELPPPADVPDLYTNQSNACGAGAPVFFSATEGQLPVSCSFPDTNKQRGWLYVTTDAGKTWTPRALPTAYGLLDFISANEGWWAGNDAGGDTTVARTLYHTTDGGRTWTAGKKLNWGGHLDFVTGQMGWAVAINGEASALVQTPDGGNKWNLLSPHIGP